MAASIPCMVVAKQGAYGYTMLMLFGCNSINNSNGLSKREETIMTMSERVYKAIKTLMENQGNEIIKVDEENQIIYSLDDDDLVFTKYQWEEGNMPDPEWNRRDFEKIAMSFVASEEGRDYANRSIRPDVVGCAIMGTDRAFVRQIHNYDFFYGKVN